MKLSGIISQNRPFLSLVLFIVALLCVYAFTGIFSILNERPQSIHLFAQADRASVALSYYEEDMNFFRPQIHHVENETGRVGMEFPLMNYLAAVSYQLFGFDEFYYRLLMLILASLGFIAAFRLAANILENDLLAGLISLSWLCSPIILYYSPNFLSGIASLSFAMMAWYCFFCRSSKISGNIALFLLLSLAGLTNISSGISIIAMLMLVMIKMTFPLKAGELLKRIPAGKPTLIAILASFPLILSWYFYSTWLKEFYSSGHFLMNTMPPNSLAEAIEVFRYFLAMWFTDIYAKLSWALIAVSMIFTFVLLKKADKSLLAVSLLLIMGNAAFFFLMFRQFADHDYYLIPLMTPFFFILLTAAATLKQYYSKHKYEQYISYAKIILLLVLLIPALTNAAKVQSYRYNYIGFNQMGVDYEAYATLEKSLNQHGITREHTIISFNDISFNISLYLMNRKGITYPEWGDQVDMAYRIYRIGDYIVANDTSHIKFASIKRFMEKPYFTHDGLMIFKIDLSEAQREMFLDSILTILKPVYHSFYENEGFQNSIKKFRDHYMLSHKEAEVQAAYNSYSWLLQGVIVPVLREHLPHDALENHLQMIEIADFYVEHKYEIIKLYEEGKLSDLHMAVLNNPLPFFLKEIKL
jgi:hypothetical protein